MRIQSIDIYWVKVPLAFVWKTSYADQRYTDTILVRMEGEGHYAWGAALSGPGELATSRVPGIAQEPDAGLLKQWTAEHVSFRV